MLSFRRLSVKRAAERTLAVIEQSPTSPRVWKIVYKHWERVLDLCRSNPGRTVDWGEVRNLFHRDVPEKILRREVFQHHMTAVFMASCGEEEGFEGALRVFAFYEG